jgi:hypothetical protein
VKIWRKEVAGIFFVISQSISKTRGLLGIFVDCGLISQKGEGPTTKSMGIF